MRDYGYFGKGTEGYMHYMIAHNNVYGSGGGGGGGNGGCLEFLLQAVIVIGGLAIGLFLLYLVACLLP